MKGVVFVEFLDMLESQHGWQQLEELLESANLASGGAYTAVGRYDWRELAQLVELHANRQCISPADILHGFGRHMFGALVERFPELVARFDGVYDLLSHVEDCIHPTVHKLYPDSELPKFATWVDDGELIMEYQSTRPLADFAHGLIDGCFDYYRSVGNVTKEPLASGARFRVTLKQEAACPTR